MKKYLFLFLFFFITSCSSNDLPSSEKQSFDNKKSKVFVSILPQKYFVEKIAGNKFDVQVMVRPGFSPATYEPTVKQIGDIKTSDLFFAIGVPFEKSWLSKIKNVNSNIKIVKTQENVPMREIEEFDEIFHNEDDHEDEGNHDDHGHDHSGYDPHIWLSPKLVKIQADNIFNALIEVQPENKEFFQDNLDKFKTELNTMSLEIKNNIDKVDSKLFMVFHPAWGYFADEFGLKQIPIEVEGKEPSLKQISKIIDFALEKNIKIVFVQKQFSRKKATHVAEKINGKVVFIDPLSENYKENLINISKEIMSNINSYKSEQ